MFSKITIHICVLLDCSDGDVVLKNGTLPSINQTEGRVEICSDNMYFSICDDFWDIRDARVICRQLNITGDGMRGKNITQLVCHNDV